MVKDHSDSERGRNPLPPHRLLSDWDWDWDWGLGNGIYVSISKYGSDTPVTRPETDKAGLSSRDRKRGGGKLKCYWNFEYSWEAWVDY